MQHMYLLAMSTISTSDRDPAIDGCRSADVTPVALEIAGETSIEH